MHIEPGRLAFTAEGTPLSEAFGDIYHSRHGGPGQARHVFLGGNDLPRRWQGRDRFVILETGFGLGLNFLATWATWRDDPARPTRLHFLSVEKHPLPGPELALAHARWPELDGFARQLRHAWPLPLAGFHRLHFEEGRLSLTLLFGDALDILLRLRARADAFYLDGFAPDRNPDMWSPRLFTTLARLAAPGASFATYTAAGGVREALAAAGFEASKRPGYGCKRDMLCGRLGAPIHQRPTAPQIGAPAGHAIVIGAGLAGSAACERLSARGWQVDLVERHAAPAQEASGNLAGVLRPTLARDDSITSRLTRACYLYALRHLESLQAGCSALSMDLCGVLQLARNAEHELLQKEIVEVHGCPSEFVSYLAREAASERTHHPAQTGGWFFPRGGWVNPPSLCAAQLSQHTDRVRKLFGRDAARLEQRSDGWCVRDMQGSAIAEAPVVILANAIDVLHFTHARGLPLRRIRGQVTHLPLGWNPSPDLVLCRQGYLTPARNGIACVGATFDFDDDDPLPRLGGHQSNLARLESILPGASVGLDPNSLGGRAAFRTATPDRLPLVGALPDDTWSPVCRDIRLLDVPRLAGLFGLLGYGARGLVWAPLAAEVLASQLSGDPPPLESDLLAAIDPARFVMRASRRSTLQLSTRRTA